MTMSDVEQQIKAITDTLESVVKAAVATQQSLDNIRAMCIAINKRLDTNFVKPTIIEAGIPSHHRAYQTMGDIQAIECCGDTYVSADSFEAHRKVCPFTDA